MATSTDNATPSSPSGPKRHHRKKSVVLDTTKPHDENVITGARATHAHDPRKNPRRVAKPYHDKNADSHDIISGNPKPKRQAPRRRKKKADGVAGKVGADASTVLPGPDKPPQAEATGKPVRRGRKAVMKREARKTNEGYDPVFGGKKRGKQTGKSTSGHMRKEMEANSGHDPVTHRPVERSLARKGSFHKEQQRTGSDVDVMGNPKKKLPRSPSSSGKMAKEFIGSSADGQYNPITGGPPVSTPSPKQRRGAPAPAAAGNSQ